MSNARVLPRGTHQAEVGKAIGQMLGGLFLTIRGMTGEMVGTGISTTGIGAQCRGLPNGTKVEIKVKE